MIEPTEADVGRRVTYAADGGNTEGTLARLTEHYAFVTWDVIRIDIVEVQRPRDPDPEKSGEDPGYDIAHERKETLVAADHPSATSFSELEWA